MVALVGLVQRIAPVGARATFDSDPGVRALAVAFAIVAWLLFVSARLTATGTRRLLGRIASVGFAAACAARLVGPEVVGDLDASLPLRLPPGTRALVAAGLLALGAAFVFLSSPARRASKRSRAS